MLYYVMATFYVLICLFLLLVVLIQQGKAGDLASAFGGSSSQAAFGARAGATLLTKVTWVVAALFMVGSLGLAILGQRGPGSVVGGAAAPAAQQSAPKPVTPSAPAGTQPATAPATPAPPAQK